MRQAARVLLVDSGERVLLVAFATDDGGTVWGTVGGGIETGEDPVDALRREVREETGLVLDDPGVEVWTRRVRFVWQGSDLDQYERIWLRRVPPFTPSTDGFTEVERTAVRGLRWWSPAELAASEERFAPRRLPALLAALLRDGPPPAPVDVGR